MQVIKKTNKQKGSSILHCTNKMATELKAIRIEIQTINFLKKQANKERRTFSGIVNKILKEYEDANKN